MSRFAVWNGLVIAACIVGSNGCALGPNARAGSTLGGLSGAAIGAITAPSGKTLQRAGIGALAGGLTGGALGELADQQDDRFATAQYARQQQFLASAVTMDQVIQMTKSGLSDDLILAQVQAKGIAAPLSTNDLIFLKNQGVRDEVIRGMQSAQRAAAPPVPPRVVHPVIVDEYYRAGPPGRYWDCPPPRYRHHHHGHPRASWSFHF